MLNVLCIQANCDMFHIVKGVSTSDISETRKQIQFLDSLLDIIYTVHSAEDPMTKSLLLPGTIGCVLMIPCSVVAG